MELVKVSMTITLQPTGSPYPPYTNNWMCMCTLLLV